MIVVHCDRVVFVMNQMDASNKRFLKGLLVVPLPSSYEKMPAEMSSLCNVVSALNNIQYFLGRRRTRRPTGTLLLLLVNLIHIINLTTTTHPKFSVCAFPIFQTRLDGQETSRRQAHSQNEGTLRRDCAHEASQYTGVFDASR